MGNDYYGGNSNYSGATVIIVIIVIIIIICIIIFAFVGFGNKGNTFGKDKNSHHFDSDLESGDSNSSTNNSSNNSSNNIDPKCNIASICKEAFKTGEEGAQKILNETLDFLATNPETLDSLGDVSSNFNGYPIVIKPGQTTEDSVYLSHINQNIVGMPIGQLNNSEVHNATEAILNGAERGNKIVCYVWQGRTKMTLVSKSHDGKLVVASGFHLDSTQ
uniref:Uncharacterized protein n=1 Tax=Pithovirus LCPAC201 TaxID=2506591 RepID=A0A481Z5V1_9VIRU|nr:MAG: hypothetical protein LCPAC201_02770 [Pithovirus LCPAC201]